MSSVATEYAANTLDLPLHEWIEAVCDHAVRSHDWTYDDIAARAGVSRVALFRWKSGTVRPRAANLRRLCIALEFDPESILARYGYPTPRSDPAERHRRFLSLAAEFLADDDMSEEERRYYEQNIVMLYEHYQARKPSSD